MTRKHTSAGESAPIRVVIITMDHHLQGAVERAREALRVQVPELEVVLHAATQWNLPSALERCLTDIARADLLIVNMLFMEDHIRAVQAALEARREACDAMVCFMSAGEIMRLSKLGAFDMSAPARGVVGLLKKLRGSRGKTADGGAKQMATLRRLPKILRFVPGKAQDVRAYFLTMQYWLMGSPENVANLVRFLVGRYARGPRASAAARLKARPPVAYPDEGLYHPALPGRITEDLRTLPGPAAPKATVGLLVMRSYVLGGDTAHYDAVIEALEARGLRVLPAFASGLDNRAVVERYFTEGGAPIIDALVSLTGFSLVGGPAFNDADAAAELLRSLDVPYLTAQAMEFSSIEQWESSAQGLMPVEATMMVAIPELDGATGPVVFAGRGQGDGHSRIRPIPDRVDVLARRVDRLIALRTTPPAERKLAIVLFAFPPNSGAAGTAAHLSVFASLHRVLTELAEAGYDVEVPASVDALRSAVLEGNAERFGAEANVAARVRCDDHVKNEPFLAEIEAQWGPAPGRHDTDGRTIHVHGRQLGNVFVGLQPSFGYEGDPMRLLFEQGFAPTHSFSAFYRHLREDFGAHAILHFGTHGALEFMPGKQTGLSAACWPDRLIQDVPNVYLYAANNPSEGTLAKRRSAATLVSYLTPPVTRAGLYRGLLDMKGSIARYAALDAQAHDERQRLEAAIRAQAEALDVELLEGPDAIEALRAQLEEWEVSLVPRGLHVFGAPPSRDDRLDHLAATATVSHGLDVPRAALEALVDGRGTASAVALAPELPREALEPALEALARIEAELSTDHEIAGLLRALDGRFVAPAPGGDLLSNPDCLPTGRNLHGFDPFRIPSGFAMADGLLQAQRLLDRHEADGHGLPSSIALVLWGTDNLKTEGGPIAQALALLGARPRYDSYGRICGALLLPLEELGRPRIDVVMTLSGIFRDLLPLQVRMLAEATYLAATADEPPAMNFVKAHAEAYAEAQGCDIETAALRVFSNADGAYGANVNHLVDSGAWSDEGELGEAYARRKCFAYGRDGQPAPQRALLDSVLSKVDLTYQNLESLELGVTTIDHYFDTLGGIGRAVQAARGTQVPVYIGDQTMGADTVRTLAEQVTLESRTRVLNPKWYEGLLEHGSEGVRQIEAHVTNTMGWSATTGQVAPWVYKQMSLTFVLDEQMRERLSQLNPKASVKLAQRLIEAHERSYWKPDPATLEALQRAGDELEDRLEGLGDPAAA